MIAPPPPATTDLRAGTVLRAGLGAAVIIADFDFETYSPAGYFWDSDRERWSGPENSADSGLFAVGAANYTLDPGAEVICLAYDLKDSQGKKHWRPGLENPRDLFDYISTGRLIEAWNVSFEKWVWDNICRKKYGFPPLPYAQLRCAMAKARAYSLPGSLDKAGEVLNINAKKDKDGKRLIDKFSKPRNPTKLDKRLRILTSQEPQDAQKFYDYNLQDIAAEAELSSKIPDLPPHELEFWQCDQQINKRGIQLDIDTIRSAITILNKTYELYDLQIQKLTNNQVSSGSQLPAMKKWIQDQGYLISSLDKEAISSLLKENLPENIKEVLSIRQKLGSASVKKLHSMINFSTPQGRIHDIFMYHGARTGRATGSGVQPQNIPSGSVIPKKCKSCNYYFGITHTECPYCLSSDLEVTEWKIGAIECAIESIKTDSLACVEYYWDDCLSVISSCLRGLFIASPGKDLICSDYSAIEAVTLAMLANEPWRIEVFNTHGKIYEASAAKISGIPLAEILEYKQKTGKHHELRALGKVAELASGYQGALGAWKAFGADKFLREEQIQEAVKSWRAASPNVVKLWYDSDSDAKSAVLNPGHWFGKYYTQSNTLYCRLLSGRYLTYHQVKIEPGRFGDQISYYGWNTNINNGPTGWIKMFLYGGKLVENENQATARDIMSHAIVNLEKNDYPVVLHVHDEVASEVPEVFGSLQEFESIMSTMPPWAKGWPIKATGGWRGKRYRK